MATHESYSYFLDVVVPEHLIFTVLTKNRKFRHFAKFRVLRPTRGQLLCNSRATQRPFALCNWGASWPMQLAMQQQLARPTAVSPEVARSAVVQNLAASCGHELAIICRA